MRKIIFILLLITVILISGCMQTKKGGKIMEITSPVFENKKNIPEKYTCDGDDINPPLEIENIPENTESLVLIMDDPDAPGGTFDHWIMWNIPVTNKIEENSVPKGAVQGKNGFGNNEYGGPCPPGEEHTYVFKLYALDTKLNLKEGARKEKVEETIKGHILEKTELLGKYAR